MEGRRPRTISSRASGRTGQLEGENTEEQQTQHQTKRQTQNRCEGGGERPGQAQKTDIEISRVRRGGGRTLHYGAGSGVVGPREADSEGEAKDHKRQAQHGVEGGAPHRAEAFVAIQYEDAGKKANLHLQTSQPQTKGHADRPDAQTVCQSNHISKWRQPRKSPRGVGRKKIWCPLLLYLVLLVVLVFFGVLLRLPAPLAPLPLAFGGADQ